MPRETSAAIGELFHGFSGYVLADAKSVYDLLFKPAAEWPPLDDGEPDLDERHEVGCWSHCRRKAWEVAITSKDPQPAKGAWHLLLGHYYSTDYIEHFARVVAHVDANYATRSDPAERIHAGTSSGGRMALFTGLQRPDLFGRLALLSPELSGPLHVWQPWLGGKEQPDARLSVWLGAGTYEGSIHRDAELLAGLLRQNGVDVETLFTHQGHSFGTWREAAVAMLRYFLTPGVFRLTGANHPFRPSTIANYSVSTWLPARRDG